MKRVKKIAHLYERSGVYYFRRAVPKDAKSAFGSVEVVRSLATGDLQEARHRLAEELREYDQTLARVRGVRDPTVRPPKRRPDPSPQEVEAAVRVWLSDRLGRERSDYSAAVEEATERLSDLSAYSAFTSEQLRPGGSRAGVLGRWIAEAILHDRGWTFDLSSDLGKRLVRDIGRAQVEFAHQARAEINGEPRRAQDERFSPSMYALDRQTLDLDHAPASLIALFDGYVVERKPRPSTVKAWSRQIASFTQFLGHDDASRVTTQDVISWKNHLLTTSPGGAARSANTVNNTYLAALRVAFGWGVDNRIVAANPAKGVRARAQRAVRLRDKGLNDQEARLILQASLKHPSPRLSPAYARAFRWVPWLCAYTGARVNEITQLRAQDVLEVDSVWVVRITPEAGQVKTNEARIVPLHQHLIDQGFLQVAQACAGPLFYDPALHRGGKKGNPQFTKVAARIAAWVRKSGVSDRQVAPNHGWRHRFKTRSRAVMEPEVRDALQGHAPRTEGEAYGAFTPAVLSEAIKRYPREVV